MNIGSRIKKRRKDLGMSAEQLAEQVGVSPSTIYRYESGDIENMGVEKIVPVANALNVSKAYLMGWPELTDIVSKVGSPNDENDICVVLQDILERLHDPDTELNFKGKTLEGKNRELLIHEIDNAIGIMNINLFK